MYYKRVEIRKIKQFFVAQIAEQQCIVATQTEELIETMEELNIEWFFSDFSILFEEKKPCLPTPKETPYLAA